jgi:hypothetical protein
VPDSRRKYIPLKEKLAAALYDMEQWRRAYYKLRSQDPGADPTSEYRFAHRSADDLIGLFDFHHNQFYIYDDAGKDTWRNLTPLLREEHREQTRKDIATIAKGKRIVRKQERHLTALEQKVMGAALRRTAKRKWPTRKFPKRVKK